MTSPRRLRSHAVLIVLCIVIPTVVNVLGGSSDHVQSNTGQDKPDISGEYTLIGERPKGFEDFISIALISNTRKRGKPSGNIRVGGQSLLKVIDLKFISAQIVGEKLTFKTETRAGINYSFEGQIDKVRLPEEEGGYEIPRLEGKLTKYRNGQKIAEAQMKFKHSEFGD